MRTIIAILLLCSATVAAPLSTTWSGSTLSMRWGDGHDAVHLNIDSQGFLIINTDPQDIYGPMERVVSDYGAFVPASAIQIADLNFGGGNDTLVSYWSVGRYALIDGANGDDVLYAPYGNRTMFMLGGEGNNFLSAYKATGTNYLYAGTGNDSAQASYNGRTYIDLGGGRNTVYSGASKGWVPYVTTVYTPGANDFWYDAGANNHYVLAPGTAATNGTITAYDFGGENTLTKNGHLFDIEDEEIISDYVSGYFDIGHLEGESLALRSNPEPPTAVLLGIVGCVVMFIRRRT